MNDSVPATFVRGALRGTASLLDLVCDGKIKGHACCMVFGPLGNPSLGRMELDYGGCLVPPLRGCRGDRAPKSSLLIQGGRGSEVLE